MRLPFRPAPEARSRSERLRSTVAPAEKRTTDAKEETRTSHRIPYYRPVNNNDHSHAVPTIGLLDHFFFIS